MRNTRRYLFLCPDRKSASGGIAVIYDLVALLTRSGYEAAVVHHSRSAGYSDHPEQVPGFFDIGITRVKQSHAGPKEKFRSLTQFLRSGRNKAKGGLPLPPLQLRDTDVIVTPEFALAEALEAFPDRQLIVFVQNPFGLMRAYNKALRRNLPIHERTGFWLGVSHICRTHIEMLGAGPAAYFPASMKPQDFPFQAEKSRLITYMPRKLPEEAAVMAQALTKNGRIDGYRLEALAGIPRKEVAKKLMESRFFISLLHKESIGFPAAEAMSAGCVVVGYDGLGGAEFFDETTGIPVTDGDVPALVQAVEQAVADYENDPERFDVLRRAGAARVNETFSVSAFETGALAAWAEINKTDFSLDSFE